MPRETMASVKADYRKKFRAAEAAFVEREGALANLVDFERRRAADSDQLFEALQRERGRDLAVRDARIAELLAANNCFEQKARDARAELGVAKGVIGHLASIVDTLANHKA